MKNLKKVLSLALVFAMVLGLCIGAMAAETQDVTTLSDWGNVAHKNAAQLLNAFNIMQGYTDKTFRPSNNVTRAEAVKMIDVGLWGGVDQADRFVGSEIAFSDVKSGDWYAGHVVYAEALGILDGFPDGTFRPNDTVTGYQMLKMALIALNYNSEVEGLTGSGWDIRTMRLATDPSASTAYNLTASLSEITNWNAPLTRDQAAQIIANMIMHSYVTYDLDRNGQIGNIKTYGKTFGETFLGMTVKHGTLVANEYGNISHTTYNAEGVGSDAIKTVNPKRSSANALVKIPTYNTDGTEILNYKNEEVILESTLADIGSPVTLYYKNSALVGAALDGWTAIEAEKNAKGEITNFEDYHADINDVTFGDPKTADYIVTTYVDTNGNNLIDYVVTTCYGKAVAVKDVTSTTNYGTVYQVTDLKWRSSYENSPVNSKQFVVESEASFTAKKGDVIAYTNQKNVYQDKTATYGIVLDAIDGTVSRVVDNATTWTHTVTIDGVAYPLVQSLLKDGKENADGTIPFGAEGTFYLYPDNSIGKFDGKVTQTETHYALIYDADMYKTTTVDGIHGEGGVGVQVCAILDDGTSGIYIVNGIWQDVGAKDDKDETVLTLVKPSDFSVDSIQANNATIKIDADGDGKAEETVTLDGFFAKDDTNHTGTNVLYLVNNKNGTGRYENKLATYTVNDDGSLNLTFVTPKTVTSGNVQAGVPTFTGGMYFTGKTLSFVQTKADTEGSKEAWTVATGLPTSNYSVTGSVDVYTAKLFGTATTNTDNSITAIVIGKDATTASKAEKTNFMYVLSDNGQVGKTSAGAAINEVTVYNSKTNAVEKIQVVGEFVVGTIYQAYDETTKALGSPIVIARPTTDAANAGFITTFSDNVIGLSVVTAKADPDHDVDLTTATKAYVVGEDTKYYIISGETSTSVSASEIGTQGVLDWGTRTDASKVEYQDVSYYQTVIIPVEGTTTAEHVIVFATEQAFPNPAN